LWPLTNFAAQRWDFAGVGIVVYLALLGAALFRGYVLSRARETDLGQRLVLAHAEERSRLGRHVHDGVLQEVNYWRLQAEFAVEAPASTEFQRLASGLGETAGELRRLAEDLQSLEHRGRSLSQALGSLAARLQERHGIPIALHLEDTGTLPAAVQDTLYRVAQEALGNACRHARARGVVCTLRDDSREVRLEVQDDGTGFDPAAIPRPETHFGLRFLADHAAWIGGRFDLESIPGRGTTVRIVVARPFRFAASA
jgi:signal transduction histidine kinase